MAKRLFITKSISSLIAETSDESHGLKRSLTAFSLIALGIGAIIGAGLFVRTAAAAANKKTARLFVPPDLSPARGFSAPVASQEPDLVFASVSVSRGVEKRV